MFSRILSLSTKALAVIAALLAGAAIVGQTYLRSRSLAEIEKDLKAVYDPDGSVVVSAETSVFVVDVVRGRLPQLAVSMDEVDSAQAASAFERFLTPIRFSRVRFDLHGVRFSPTKVLGGANAFEADSGSLVAEVSDSELTNYFQSQGYALTLTVSPEEVSVTTRALGYAGNMLLLSGKARLELTDNALALVPIEVDQRGVERSTALDALEAFAPIPSLAAIRFQSVRLGDRVVSLEAPTRKLFGEETPEAPESQVPGPPGIATTVPSPTAEPTESPRPASPTPRQRSTPKTPSSPTVKLSPSPTKTPTRSP